MSKNEAHQPRHSDPRGAVKLGEGASIYFKLEWDTPRSGRSSRGKESPVTADAGPEVVGPAEHPRRRPVGAQPSTWVRKVFFLLHTSWRRQGPRLRGRTGTGGWLAPLCGTSAKFRIWWEDFERQGG